MLHIPGLSHRQHRKHTQDARQASSAAAAPTSAAGLASTSTHVVAETHHLRYLPIKKRHGLFRKPTHHMYEVFRHALSRHPHRHGASFHSTATLAAAHALTSSTSTTTALNDERVPATAAQVTPPAPRRYGTDISTTARMHNVPVSTASPTTGAATGPSSPLATATAPESDTTAMGAERTQGNEDRELLIKTTTRATPAIVDPGIVPVSARAETGGEYYERREVASYAASNMQEQRGVEEYGRLQEGETAPVSTNDMDRMHPPVMPAGEWVETHYRTESGRFEEVVGRD
ncbi:hypothetical protein BCR44DRAFT_1446415 [Catenaria anguillulae PL171]|uniref:Uncharacterized protein n=1 Tax=Catenaria anguillulae PL171 TaxID=765915 RepID=A0A1Y2H667_9FUNG|nr:hypothetical protein BCR44DRAFT_1446415 [Catenaria anguillulae PL171]